MVCALSRVMQRNPAAHTHRRFLVLAPAPAPASLRRSPLLAGSPYALDPGGRFDERHFAALRQAEARNRRLFELRQALNDRDREIGPALREAGRSGDAAGAERLQREIASLRAAQQEVRRDIEASAREVALLRRRAGVSLRAPSASERHKGDPQGYAQAAAGQLRLSGNLVVLGDLHLSGKADGLTEARFEGVLALLSAHRDTIRFVVLTGDVVDARAPFADRGERIEHSTLAIRRIAEALGMTQERARRDILAVVGNHDLVRADAGAPAHAVVAPPAGADPRGPRYDRDFRDALLARWAEWSCVVTRHPLESADVPVPGRSDGATMSVGHDVPLRADVSRNAGRLYSVRHGDLPAADAAGEVYFASGSNIGRISADRHMPIDLRGPKLDARGRVLAGESVFYVAAGTLGEAKPADAPRTILIANLTAAGDGCFYQWEVSDPDEIRPILVEHPAYEAPRIAPPADRGAQERRVWGYRGSRGLLPKRSGFKPWRSSRRRSWVRCIPRARAALDTLPWTSRRACSMARRSGSGGGSAEAALAGGSAKARPAPGERCWAFTSRDSTASAACAAVRASPISSRTLPGQGRRRHASIRDTWGVSPGPTRLTSRSMSQGTSSRRWRSGGRSIWGRPMRK